jgi:hypothetical protein
MKKDISTTEIVRLYTKEKAAYRTIATCLGVSVEVVRGRLKKAGVSSRTAGEGKHQSQLRRMEMELKQAIQRGQQFGSWTVIGPLKIGNRHRTYWKCRCDCALQTEKFIRLDILKVGSSISCGACPNLNTSQTPLTKILGIAAVVPKSDGVGKLLGRIEALLDAQDALARQGSC